MREDKNFFNRALAIAVLIVVGLLPLAQMVWAHGGGQPRLVNEVSGDFIVSAWTSVEAKAEGEELHISVGLADIDSAEPMLNRTIQVSAENGRTQAGPLAATHENAINKLYYEADMLLEHGGTWTIRIDIEGNLLEFDMVTSGDPPPRFAWLPAVIIFVIAATVGWNLPKFLTKP